MRHPTWPAPAASSCGYLALEHVEQRPFLADRSTRRREAKLISDLFNLAPISRDCPLFLPGGSYDPSRTQGNIHSFVFLLWSSRTCVVYTCSLQRQRQRPQCFFRKRWGPDGVHSGACLIQYHKRYQCSGEQFRYETVIGVLCYMHVAET